MERSSKRGKIPQRDWPVIIKRYEAGETLASIARTYDCSPPAISYILSRHRARDGSMEHPARPPSAVLVEGTAGTIDPVEAAQGKTEASGAALENRGAKTTDLNDGFACARHAAAEQMPAANGTPEASADPIAAASEKDDATEPDEVPPATIPIQGRLRSVGLPQNGEERRTLHLSPAQEDAHQSAVPPGGGQPILSPQSGSQRANFHASAPPSAVPTQKAREGVPSIDRALRERVDEDIAAFLAAFDAALAEDSLESRAGLREATDRLLRAGARTRIELERLEARLPLSAREDRAHHAPWRPR